MGQVRLHFPVAGADAERVYQAVEAAFEEDGLPLALVELDEEAGLKEISLYAEEEQGGETAARIAAILTGLGLSAAVETEVLPDIDWVTHTLTGLQPVRAGNILVHGSHDRDRIEPGDIAIEIEAGLAFGTGHHGTTLGCLETIADVLRAQRPRIALDLGTGSAVLAIAIAKLDQIPVLATDIDPVAVEVAQSNVRLNGVAGLVETHTAEGFGDPIFARRGPFDLIVANILAGPLQELAPGMAGQLAPGGTLILSGILARQEQAVLAAYSAEGFRHLHTLPHDEWVTLRLER